MPGLVDAHCHVGLESTAPFPTTSPSSTRWPNAPPGRCCCGTPAARPTPAGWTTARTCRGSSAPVGTSPGRSATCATTATRSSRTALVAAVERQAARGDGWVKLVGDWIDRAVGDLTPLWPAEVAKAGIDRAHELGCRVTAHVFGEQAVAELVEAGIDGIEHGTGLDDADHRPDGGAPGRAGADDDPARELPGLRRRRGGEVPGVRAADPGPLRPAARDVRGRARRRACPIYAGTDAGGYLPHGIVGREIAAMGAFMSAEQALGAGSWRARAWLGRPDVLDEGAPGRPRRLRRGPSRRPAVLSRPAAVVLRGRRVA